jgi:hypothetical protein
MSGPNLVETKQPFLAIVAPFYLRDGEGHNGRSSQTAIKPTPSTHFTYFSSQDFHN